MLSLQCCLQCCLLGLLISTNQSLLLILKSILLVLLVNFDIFLFSVFFSLWEIFLDWWSWFISRNLISCTGVSSIYIGGINNLWAQSIIKNDKIHKNFELYQIFVYTFLCQNLTKYIAYMTNWYIWSKGINKFCLKISALFVPKKSLKKKLSKFAKKNLNYTTFSSIPPFHP